MLDDEDGDRLGAAWILALPVPCADQAERHLDWLGASTLALPVSALLFGLNRGPEWGWTSPGVLAAFFVVPAAAYAFVAAERRADDPLIPLAYLRRRNFAFPIAAQVFANFAYMGGFILAPLLLERVYGLSESHVGLVVIARPLAFSLSAPIAGYLAVRLGERTSVVAGALAVGASMLVFASLGPRSADLVIVGALVLSGIGLGVATPSVAASVANAVDEENLGIAGAAQQLLTQVGIVAGIQLAETVQAARESVVGVVASYHEAYLLAGAACVLGLICGLFVKSAERGEREPRIAPLIREAA